MKSEDYCDCSENENFNIKMPTALYYVLYILLLTTVGFIKLALM